MFLGRLSFSTQANYHEFNLSTDVIRVMSQQSLIKNYKVHICKREPVWKHHKLIEYWSNRAVEIEILAVYRAKIIYSNFAILFIFVQFDTIFPFGQLMWSPYIIFLKYQSQSTASISSSDQTTSAAFEFSSC